MNARGRKYTGLGNGNATLMGPMIGTPAPGSLPELERLISAVADNTPMCEVYPPPPGGGRAKNTQGFRDMLIQFSRITGQEPALLSIYRKAYLKTKRELDMHAREHKRGIDLAIKKAKGL